MSHHADTAPLPARPPASAVLKDLADGWPAPRITLGAIVAAMEDRAYGPLLLIFALPNVLPAPPGLSAILGVPLILFAAQLVIGRHRPWLPRLLADRSFAIDDFGRFLAKATPWLHRAERLLKPRLRWATRFSVERAAALLCLVLSVVVTLPIPLGNMIPALAICVIALGLFEKDGVFVLAGCVIGLVGVTIAGGVVVAAAKAAVFFLVAGA
ncbi:MAG: exopolysaccharide biosynthesis protein [Caenispirillum sp.]|nr:exopolysaccharide biosynthesis protein [Caenispirillum sp.]